MILIVLLSNVSALEWLGLTRDNEACDSSALSSSQKRLCAHKNGRFSSAVQRAATMTIASCSENMKNEKWGCAGIERLPHRSSTLKSSTAERAYLDQLSSAHLISSIYHLCQSGTVGSCSTQEIMAFVHQFTSIGLRRKKFEKIALQVESHNLAQGRKLAWAERRQICKCHGASGSCTKKTCWTTTPDVRQMNEKATQKYKTALKLDLEGSLPAEIVRLVASDRLIYLNKSDDFCKETVNRQCQIHDFSRNSHCSKLCCGRDATRKEEMIVEQECAFVWPDSIRCAPKATRVVKYLCN